MYVLPPVVRSVKGFRHRVGANESPGRIAYSYTGDAGRYHELVAANAGKALTATPAGRYATFASLEEHERLHIPADWPTPAHARDAAISAGVGVGALEPMPNPFVEFVAALIQQALLLPGVQAALAAWAKRGVVVPSTPAGLDQVAQVAARWWQMLQGAYALPAPADAVTSGWILDPANQKIVANMISSATQFLQTTKLPGATAADIPFDQIPWPALQSIAQYAKANGLDSAAVLNWAGASLKLPQSPDGSSRFASETSAAAKPNPVTSASWTTEGGGTDWSSWGPTALVDWVKTNWKEIDWAKLDDVGFWTCASSNPVQLYRAYGCRDVCQWDIVSLTKGICQVENNPCLACGGGAKPDAGGYTGDWGDGGDVVVQPTNGKCPEGYLLVQGIGCVPSVIDGKTVLVAPDAKGGCPPGYSMVKGVGCMLESKGKKKDEEEKSSTGTWWMLGAAVLAILSVAAVVYTKSQNDAGMRSAA